MPDVIEQLHAYADTVTDTVPAVANPRIADLAMPHVRGRRSPVRVAIAVGTGVVLVGGAAWFGVRLSRTTSAPRRVPTTTPTSIAHLRTVTPPPGVQILEPPPLSPRGDSASAWTGSELVIWGGDVEAFNMGLPGPDRMFVDGAAYNLAAHAWRPISNGPLPANATTPVAVATTTEVVIVRGRNVAAWNPTTDTWRSLGDAPADVSDLVSTGQAVLSASANASLDLRSGRWRSLPARPIDFVSGSSVWTGRELVAFGADIFAAAYDPARDAWRKLPNAPEIRGSGSSLSWDGERVIAVDYDDRAASYRPDRNTWTALPRIPVRFAEGGVHASAVAPEAFVLTSGAVAVLDPQDHWVPLPYPTTASMLVPVRAPGQTSPIPTSVFMIGNQYPGGGFEVALVDPAMWITNPPEIQVGLVAVTLPTNAKFETATASGNGLVEGLEILLSTPQGPCTLTSTYLGASGQQPLPRWVRTDASGHEWTGWPSTSDRVTVRCDDPATAAWIAQHTPLPPKR